MIYDCFTFFDELDLLEVRLNELSDVVDRFVLVEATQTFQGDPKPLHFQMNRSRFAAFEDKIIHVIVEFPDELPKPFSKDFSQAWLREFYQRDQISRGLVGAKASDLVIVSDVDEIIKAEKLKTAIASRSAGMLTVFELSLYNGFVDRKQNKDKWLLGPRLIEFCYFKSAQKLRLTKIFASRFMPGSVINRLHTRLWNFLNCQIANNLVLIEDAGWHLTSLGGWEAWRKKANSFAHEEAKAEERYGDEEKFTRFIRETTSVISVDELPIFIQRNPRQFPFFGT
jgi:beta-1,4-mannosyl-glycoprotein beta-1,4-N-acetylglucosaminyltransferase